jgi:hypothetical protein
MALKQVAPVALLFIMACGPRMAAPVYGPWEEGLTLAFEDPSQPQPQRSAERLQVRVGHSPMNPGPPSLVRLDVASPRGQMSLFVQHRDGGIALVTEQGRILSQVLPTGFPATTSWVERGTEYRILGRSTWEGASILPATSDPVGVWVEARAPHGAPRRTLYLPNLGEVESMELRDGAWVSVNRLVARGFTDLPAQKRP